MFSAAILLKDHEAPRYMREVSITSGYRQKLSYKACMYSWFWIHNETVNIWSHLIGFLIFVYWLFAIIWTPPREISSYFELFPLVVQLLSYMACMLSSTLFHTFSCHSEDAHRSWRFADHFGIMFALCGTYVSLISNTFNCFPPWNHIHLTVVLTLFTWVVFFKCRSKSDECRIPLEYFLYMATYSAIPIAHWVWLQGGLNNGHVLDKLTQIIPPFISGGVGLVFYVSRFPEKLCSGSVDIFGASHQVWHVLIFLGMAFWYHETSTSFAKESEAACLNMANRNESSSNTNAYFDDDGWFGYVPSLDYYYSLPRVLTSLTENIY